MNASLQFRMIMAGLMVCLGILILIPITEAAVTSSDSVTITGYILPHTAPDANFTATPVSGTAPLTVQFTDLSTGSPTGWQWDFEYDGIIDSTEQSPPHIYTVAGTYSVSLTVTNLQGSDTLVRTGYITVAPQDPLTRIRTLEAYANGLSILEWSKWLLTSPLTNAEKQLEKGNERPAINQMRSFIDNVRLLRWFGFISQGQADYMIAEANAIVTLIEA
jgi:PKD repeat protein